MLFEGVEFGPYDKAEHKANKAFELYEDGKMSLALEELETAIDINPYNSCWHFDKALMLDSMSQFDEAIVEYERALELCPNDLEILNSLAIDYTRTGLYDKAIEIFELIQQLDPTFEPCYCNRIITYTEMDKHDLAEQMFYLAQQINPDCALCYYNIGNSLFARSQYKKAVRCWLRTAELEPIHPQINYRIAQAYWAVGDVEHAREHFIVELRNNPGDVDVIFDYGLLLLELGDIESAKEKFNRILELQEDFAPALFYLGEIAYNSGDYERAVELYKQASQKNPPNGGPVRGPYYRLSQLALAKNSKTKARIYLVSELELEPDDADVLVSMASMFLAIAAKTEDRRQKTGDRIQKPALSEACAERSRSVEGTKYRRQKKRDTRPETHVQKHRNHNRQWAWPSAQHGLATGLAPLPGDSLRHKQYSSFADSDLDYATNCLLRAVDIDPTNADAYYYLGLVSVLKGRLEDAAEFFFQALDINDKHIAALRDSALVYLLMGELVKAHERINKAKALAGNYYKIETLHCRIWFTEKRQKLRDFFCLRPWISHRK
jgi:tetratricopeptide (TPR) repeat protein